MVRQVAAAGTAAAGLGLAALGLAAGGVAQAQTNAQIGAAMDSNAARIEDLITASHILANEGILDSFGHATVRSASDPSHFFMPRAMPPALVSRADIVELDLDCKPVTPNAPRLNGERYIHCEVYTARSERPWPASSAAIRSS